MAISVRLRTQVNVKKLSFQSSGFSNFKNYLYFISITGNMQKKELLEPKEQIFLKIISVAASVL